ncbi:MAG: DUF1214 domain-containing protein [Salinisphaeraceae bacterium]|nr:DUF1214 domain-containing protein [Salinisphaeraceae bacterium]
MIKALMGFKKIRLLMLKLRGKTEADVSAQRIVNGTAWEEYCDTLKAAGTALLYPGAPRDAFNQAEGVRYLSRLVRAGLEAFIEYADPKAPVLKRMVHETVKMGSDNPDNNYQNATISGEYEYRISGNRGSVHYLGFGVQSGSYGKGGGLKTTAYVEAKDLQIDADGNFELILSCNKQEGNWLPMEPETSLVIVRQTFMDRVNEVPAELSIERIGGDGLPSPVTAQSIDEGLNTAGTLVAGASMLFAKWARDWQKQTNELPLFDPEVSTAAGGDPNITYYHGYWKLAADEALVIEATPPECEAWNFQLDNHWLESLDYRYFQIHVNKHTAQYRNDGSVQIVVAHSDPGLPNWINTVGHDCGAMSFRWIRADEKPQPQCRVVKFAEIAQS